MFGEIPSPINPAETPSYKHIKNQREENRPLQSWGVSKFKIKAATQQQCLLRTTTTTTTKMLSMINTTKCLSTSCPENKGSAKTVRGWESWAFSTFHSPSSSKLHAATPHPTQTPKPLLLCNPLAPFAALPGKGLIFSFNFALKIQSWHACCI